MVNRIAECTKFCTSKADLIDALDLMCYYGFAERVTNGYTTCAVTSSRSHKFAFEYDNADKEPVKVKFSHIWIKDYSDILIIDNDLYDADLLLNEFGGVLFKIIL